MIPNTPPIAKNTKNNFNLNTTGTNSARNNIKLRNSCNELMDTNFIRIKDTYNIAIHIPLIDRANILEMYEIITFSKKGTSYRFIEIPKGKIFALSPTMEKIVITNSEDIKKCKQQKGISLCHMNDKMETNEKLLGCIGEIVAMGNAVGKKCETKISTE